jgi:very-short-patch-repair endonuclease
MAKKKKRQAAWAILRQTTEFDQIPGWVPSDAVRTFSAAMGQYILDDAHGFWLEPDANDGHSDPDRLIVTIGQRINALGHCYNGATTQSPIEDQLIGALMWLDMDWCGFPDCSSIGGPDECMKVFGPRDQIDFWIAPQAAIGRYRVDVLIWMTYGRTVAGIAVECDGHAFDEKTKEQASRDKKRDREILQAGFPVVRFSGSDIFKSPCDCVAQIGDLLSDARDRVSRAAGLYA